MINVLGEDILTLRIEPYCLDCSNKVHKKEQLGWTRELRNVQGEEIVLKTCDHKREIGVYGAATSQNDHRGLRKTPVNT